MPNFVDANTVTLGKIAGENLSVARFRFSSDDPQDWGPAFTRAIQSAMDAGGKDILVPGNPQSYKFKTRVTFPAGCKNIFFTGEGDGSILELIADIPDGFGWFNLSAGSVSCGFYNLSLEGISDGAPMELRYGITGAGGDFDNDPMNPLLTRNSTIWIPSGVRDFYLEECSVRHTGGYLILANAEGPDGDIDGITVRQLVAENNRPHTFGNTTGDTGYGSWTGGIFYRGDCRSGVNTNRVRNLKVSASTFRRGTGNQIWGHCRGFDSHHEAVSVNDCVFEDIGRDPVLIGNVLGGNVTGCSILRAGYVATADSGLSVPKLLPGHYAVGIDTSGFAKNITYQSNVIRSVFGGALDLDGLRDSSVLDNDDDGALHYSPASPVHVGVNLGNTSANGGGERIKIGRNRFRNCNFAAIRLNNAVDAEVYDNDIDHPPTAAEVPIQIWSDSNKATGVIKRNRINFAGANYCIFEYGSLNSSCRFEIFDNVITGANSGEFLKDPATTSAQSRAWNKINGVSGVSLPAGATFTAIGGNADDGSGAVAQVTGYVNASVGYRTTSAATDAINVPNGGAAAKYLIGLESMFLLAQGSPPAAPGAGQGKMYFDGTGFRYWDFTVAGWRSLLSAYNLDVGRIPFGSSTSDLTSDALFNFNATTKRLAVNLSSASVALDVGGDIRATGGIKSEATGAAIAFQVGAGSFQIDGNGNVSGAGSANFATAYKWAGTDFALAGTGGNLRLQAYEMVATTVFNSTATGSTIAFQAGGGNFQVSGAGNVSGAGQCNFGAGYITGNWHIRHNSGTGSLEFVHATGPIVRAEISASGRLWLAANDGVNEGGQIELAGTGSWPWVSVIDRVQQYVRIFSGDTGGYQEVHVFGRPGVAGLYCGAGWIEAPAFVAHSTFNSLATGATIGLQVNGGNFQVNGNGDASGAGTANFTGGYTGGSFRGAGVATQANGVGGGSFAVWNGSTYSTYATHSGGGNVTLAANLVNGTTVQQNGTNISSLFAPISHNHDGSYYLKSQVYTKTESDGNTFAALDNHLDAYHRGSHIKTINYKDHSNANASATVYGP